MSQRIDLACAADARYVAHSAAMLHSALAVAGCRLVVHYLHGPELGRADRARLTSMFVPHGAELSFYEVASSRIANLPVQSRFGTAMWYRILLPELLPDVERVLYMDVDTIVTDDLDPLFALDLGEHLLAAVRNVFMEFHRYRLRSLDMAPFEYFNSGVMLFNLAAMRAADFAAGLVELVRRERGELVWPDQDALNVAARGRWLGLHPRWNCMNSFFSRPRLAREVFGASLLSEAVEQPAIRHFEGPDFNKPWHLLHGRGGQRLYREHRVGTPWPEYSLEGRSAANRLKRVLADVQACTRARRSAGRA